jgi:pimeloyl-ACP methyl ester carboxylesterase
VARPGRLESNPAEAAFPELDGVEHRYVDLPGLRVHLAEAGRGEPVLLLHGVPQHWWEWRKVIPGLAERYRVIVPDLRGAGWTDAPSAGYSRDQQLADVLALLDVLELERVDLVTHDVGALVGYQLCLNHPSRVRRHLSLSIPPPYFELDARFVLSFLRYVWFDLLLPVPALGPALLRRGRQGVARHMLLGMRVDPSAVSDEDAEIFLGRLRDPARARAVSSLYRHCILPEAARIMAGRYRKSRLRTPTHVVIGSEDPNIRHEFLHGFEEYVDDLEMEYVDRAAHFVAEDRPDVVVERALELFAKP